MCSQRLPCKSADSLRAMSQLTSMILVQSLQLPALLQAVPVSGIRSTKRGIGQLRLLLRTCLPEDTRLPLTVYRSVENYVAIIVGSSPGFASFMRTFVLKSTVVLSVRSRIHAMRMSSLRSLLKKQKAINDSSWGPPSGSSYSSEDIEALKRLPSRYHVTVGTLPGGTIHMMSSYQPE